MPRPYSQCRRWTSQNSMQANFRLWSIPPFGSRPRPAWCPKGTLACVPALVGVQLLANLQAEGLHALQRLTQLLGLRTAVQVPSSILRSVPRWPPRCTGLCAAWPP